MLKTAGTNLFGLKEQDQIIYMNAFSNIFNNNIGEGQIYTYEVPANVEGYVKDYDYLKSNLDIINRNDNIKYKILDKASNRLEDTAVTMELVDRCFIIILKDRDYISLERRLKDVISHLSSYQKTTYLTSKEMIDIVYDYYNPASGKFISTQFNEKYGMMDLIYPDYIGYVNQGFHQAIEINGKYCKTKWVSTFDKEPVQALLCYLATYPQCEFSLHWSPAPQDSIKRDLDKSVKALDSQIKKEKEASALASKQKQLNENLDMVEKIVQEGSFAIYFSVSIRITAESPEMLKAISEELDKYCKNELNIKIRDGLHQPLEMFNLSAPICCNEVENYMLETTADTMAYMYPFVFEALYDSTTEYDKETNQPLFNYPPVYIGNTKNTNGVVFYDNFVRGADRTSSNEFIVGTTGMGKTLYLMWLIKQRHALGYKQFIIDVEGKELHKLTYALGGENINCANGLKGRINPLHIRFNIPDDEDWERKVPLSEIFPLSEHIRFLRSFFSAYKGNATADIRLLHDNMIEKACINVYRKIGITFDSDAESIRNNFSNDDYPIMMDLYNELHEMLKTAQAEEARDITEITRIKECIAFVEPLACGADANIFNGVTNINLNNSLFCFNISGLQDNTNNKVLQTQYFNVLSFIWTSIISNPDQVRQQIYADEFSVIMDPRFQDIMLYFQSTAKRARKYYCGLTTATQMISDVLKPEVRSSGEAIIAQSTYQFYFGLGGNGAEYLKGKDKLVPESEIDFIQFAGIGDCYAKFGSQTAMRIHITLPDEELEYFKRMKD